MKVLIVDDEILVRKGIAMGIEWEALGFNEVYEASNGVEALEIVHQVHPNLIFTDIKMPKMDGLVLIDEIKKVYPDIVILVLSCINDSDYVRKALKFNRAIDYIPKLSMGTDELKEIVIKAKSYIKINNEPTSKYIPIFSGDRIHSLREAIKHRNGEEVKKILKNCFYEAKSYYNVVETFIEWHDIFSVFSTVMKEAGGNVHNIKIADVEAYEYLRRANNLDELEERFNKFALTYLESLIELEGAGLSKEIKNAITYIRNRYALNLRLQDVAMEIGLNDTYLSRIFKKQLGMNFSDYLNKVRLENAKELLNTKKLPIYEIAEKVGYNSESYFSRIFKQYYGITPKQYQMK
ncbi:response regulator transcription factor [Vallitalea maricola]|uniref:Uncharacterized protein n=1 Tax=Vallitalea maricola TaxID=3074433 RepID=A0ACB5UHB9_9FIRM|nr:hypothetical protein AN2V17_13770 [Vallitalea sp. AN17-2]